MQEILHTMSLDSDVKMTLRTDSDAARGMIHLVGCGRVRHLQTRYLRHHQALREGQFNVVRFGTKEYPRDLGTKALEREAMASCMSKLAIIPASTLRGAIVAALTRVTSASNNVIADGCCLTRVGNTTSGVANTAGLVSTFVASVGAGGAVVVMMLVWLAAMSKYSGWSRQTLSSAEAQSSCLRTGVEQCAQVVRHRISHNRSTSQVTDQGLPCEHKKCCVWRRKR